MPSLIRVALIALLLVGPAQPGFSEEEPLPPRDCTNQASHNKGNTPHTEDADGDGVSDQCHGTPGDDGSCIVASGTTGQSASVRCAVSVNPGKPTRTLCAGFITCGPGLPSLSCGGERAEAWAGISPSGRAFYFCIKDGVDSSLKC